MPRHNRVKHFCWLHRGLYRGLQQKKKLNIRRYKLFSSKKSSSRKKFGIFVPRIHEIVTGRESTRDVCGLTERRRRSCSIVPPKHTDRPCA